MDLTFGPREDFILGAAAGIVRALHRYAQPCVGLATGSTPIPVYRRIFQQARKYPSSDASDYIPPDTRAFAIDEYCWPDLNHPGTNASFFDRHWLNHPTAPQVRLPQADAPDPDAEIAEHCRAIARCGGFDVVLLGIGRNGHIAFNEPGSDLSSGCRVVRLDATTREDLGPEWAEKPEHGMTVGMRQIIASREVILLATGTAKRQILCDALTGPVKREIPASFLQRHPRLTVICDWEAGDLLYEASDLTSCPLPDRETVVSVQTRIARTYVIKRA